MSGIDTLDVVGVVVSMPAMAMLMMIVPGVIAVVMAATEMAMSVPLAAHLPHEVVKAKGNQRPARNPGKNVPGPLAGFDAEPDDKGAKSGCEQHMAGAAQGNNRDCLDLAPFLAAAGKNERQPVCWYGGMGKGDDETRRHNGKKKRLIHLNWPDDP